MCKTILNLTIKTDSTIEDKPRGLSCLKLWTLSRNLYIRARRLNFRSVNAGADPGFFLGGVAPLRNGVTDWWRKQIIKANTKKKAFD